MRQARFGRSVRFCIRRGFFKALTSFFCNCVALARASELPSAHGYKTLSSTYYIGESAQIKEARRAWRLGLKSPSALGKARGSREARSALRVFPSSGAIVRPEGRASYRTPYRATNSPSEKGPAPRPMPLSAPSRAPAGCANQPETQKGLRTPWSGLGWGLALRRA